ncbi:dentin sialophosphoprotein-like isoform X2 [Varroa destructor]|uniref:BTB domain-containing protein n=1 Tax=Varroa destructor TaxID=109461 RepID=A0A7M7MJJ9_VARDE|nr:dentin sialophosphoprotein-like isoform X2 [Varroa destructor]
MSSMMAHELQSVAVVKVDNRQFLIPASLLHHHCPILGPCLSTNLPLIRVNIEGIKAPTFKLIENYIRTGQFPDITVQNVIDLYAAATNLGMIPLAKKCQEQIYKRSVEDQMLTFYVECERANNPTDAAASLDMMSKTFKKIALSKGITELNETQLIKVIDSGPVKKRPQAERFIAVLRWLQTDCRGRSERAKSLLSRFNLNDKSLAGCEVCPEITKHVPALKLLANLPLPERVGTGKGCVTASTSLKGTPVTTITGGSTAVTSSRTKTAATKSFNAKVPLQKAKAKQKKVNKTITETFVESPDSDISTLKAKKTNKALNKVVPENFKQVYESVTTKSRGNSTIETGGFVLAKKQPPVDGGKSSPSLKGAVQEESERKGTDKPSEVTTPKGRSSRDSRKSLVADLVKRTTAKFSKKQRNKPIDANRTKDPAKKSQETKLAMFTTPHADKPSEASTLKDQPKTEVKKSSSTKALHTNKPSDVNAPKDQTRKSSTVKTPSAHKPSDANVSKDRAKRSSTVKTLRADKPSDASALKDQSKIDQKKSPTAKTLRPDKHNEANSIKDKARSSKKSTSAKASHGDKLNETKSLKHKAKSPKKSLAAKAPRADKPSDATSPKKQEKKSYKKSVVAKTLRVDKPSDASSPKDQSKKSPKKSFLAKTLRTDKPSDASRPKDQEKSPKMSSVAKTLRADKPSDASRPKDQEKSPKRSRVAKTRRIDKPSDASSPKTEGKKSSKMSSVAKTLRADKPSDASRPKDQEKSPKKSRVAKTRRIDKPSDASSPKTEGKKSSKKSSVAKTLCADKPSDASRPKDQEKSPKKSRVAKTRRIDKPSDASSPKTEGKKSSKKSSVAKTLCADKASDASRPKDQEKSPKKSLVAKTRRISDASSPKTEGKKSPKKSSVAKTLCADKPSDASRPKDQEKSPKKSLVAKTHRIDKPSDASSPKTEGKNSPKKSSVAKTLCADKPSNASRPKNQEKSPKKSLVAKMLHIDKSRDASASKNTKKNKSRPTEASRADKPTDASTSKDQAKKTLRKYFTVDKPTKPAPKLADKPSDLSTTNDQAKKTSKKSRFSKTSKGNVAAPTVAQKAPSNKSGERKKSAHTSPIKTKNSQSKKPSKEEKPYFRLMAKKSNKPKAQTSPSKQSTDASTTMVEKRHDVLKAGRNKRREAKKSPTKSSSKTNKTKVHAEKLANAQRVPHSPMKESLQDLKQRTRNDNPLVATFGSTLAGKGNNVGTPSDTQKNPKKRKHSKRADIATDHKCNKKHAQKRSGQTSAQPSVKSSDMATEVPLSKWYSGIRTEQLHQARKAPGGEEVSRATISDSAAKKIVKNGPTNAQQSENSALKAPAAAIPQQRNDKPQGSLKKGLIKWPRGCGNHTKQKKIPDAKLAEAGVKNRKSKSLWKNLKKPAKIFSGGH